MQSAEPVFGTEQTQLEVPAPPTVLTGSRGPQRRQDVLEDPPEGTAQSPLLPCGERSG